MIFTIYCGKVHKNAKKSLQQMNIKEANKGCGAGGHHRVAVGGLLAVQESRKIGRAMGQILRPRKSKARTGPITRLARKSAESQCAGTGQNLGPSQYVLPGQDEIGRRERKAN